MALVPLLLCRSPYSPVTAISLVVSARSRCVQLHYFSALSTLFFAFFCAFTWQLSSNDSGEWRQQEVKEVVSSARQQRRPCVRFWRQRRIFFPVHDGRSKGCDETLLLRTGAGDGTGQQEESKPYTTVIDGRRRSGGTAQTLRRMSGPKRRSGKAQGHGHAPTRTTRRPRPQCRRQ